MPIHISIAAHGCTLLFLSMRVGTALAVCRDGGAAFLLSSEQPVYCNLFCCRHIQNSFLSQLPSIEENFRRFAALGLEIHITEMDVRACQEGSQV